MPVGVDLVDSVTDFYLDERPTAEVTITSVDFVDPVGVELREFVVFPGNSLPGRADPFAPESAELVYGPGEPFEIGQGMVFHVGFEVLDRGEGGYAGFAVEYTVDGIAYSVEGVGNPVEICGFQFAQDQAECEANGS